MDLKSALSGIVSDAAFLSDQAHQYSFLISIFRYLLQISAYSALETACYLGTDPSELGDIAAILAHPSDGDYIAAVDSCLPLYLSDRDFRLLVSDDLEIFGQKRSELRGERIQLGEERLAGVSELAERFVIAVVKHLALEKLPKSLD